MAVPFANFQNEIYFRGMAGERPQLTTDLGRLENAAREAMSPEAFGYVAGSAGGGATARANRAAFDRLAIVPRMMRDVSLRDLSTTVLGTTMPAPVVLAPIGVQAIVHPDGELASARAAAAAGLVFTQSTAAAHPLEAVAEASGAGPRWYQLYWPSDREVAASLVARAGAAGYSALDRHRRHLHAGLAADRPRRRLPAVPPGHRDRQLPHRSRLQRPPGPGRSARGQGAPVGRHVRRPDPRPGTTSPGCGSGPASPSPSRASSTPTTPGPRSTPASTASSCRTTVADRSTAPSPRSTRCPP